MVLEPSSMGLLQQPVQVPSKNSAIFRHSSAGRWQSLPRWWTSPTVQLRGHDVLGDHWISTRAILPSSRPSVWMLVGSVGTRPPCALIPEIEGVQSAPRAASCPTSSGYQLHEGMTPCDKGEAMSNWSARRAILRSPLTTASAGGGYLKPGAFPVQSSWTM